MKLAVLDAAGRLGAPRTRPAPRPTGSGAIRELDADAYRACAEALLADAPALPLGVACQRSSFVLFERAGGRPRTPLVSWQDRRAADWCDRHRALEPELFECTGLPLSPHYAGPKLAAMIAEDPSLGAGLAAGELLFGTLETYLAWHWSGGEHRTDLSMAARTQLADPARGVWSPRLLEVFGVAARALPTLGPSCGLGVALDGGRTWAASVADQAAGLVAALGGGERGTLVNLGTGSFVLRATGAANPRRAGYLTGPVFAAPDGRPRFALEGTINGGGATADRIAPGPTVLPSSDPAPEAFCLPDENGVGAPHWRARPAQTGAAYSAAARSLAPADRRRVTLEGLVFRVREILDDLAGERDSEAVLLSGGLTHEPFVAAALAACLGREVRVLLEEETTLLGAARLAVGLADAPAPKSRAVAPPPAAGWLRAKYERWRAWSSALLETS